MPDSEIRRFKYKCFMLYEVLMSSEEDDPIPDYVFDNLIAQSVAIIGVQ